MQHNDLSDPLQWLLSRKSAVKLVEPAPGKAEIAKMVEVALTVPDHGLLKPYRFVEVAGDARHGLLEAILADRVGGERGVADTALKERVQRKLFAAPLMLFVISSPMLASKIPVWEQQTTAGCTGYALTLAAHALGYGAAWKSFPFEVGRAQAKWMGLQPHESVLGWVNLGSHIDPTALPSRQPVPVEDFYTRL
ncbi:MAG: nitroreductase family protein [Zetaproteobacteria bacterium]|nr:nitroreductase family protein [Zetaproteobacteria bacterium]